MPKFLSHSATAGLASDPLPIPMERQQVQELFDNTGTWRQARIDLSNYAGDDQLMLRFDFSTAGLMNDPTLGYVEDWNEDGVVSRFEGFGEFFSSQANYDPVRGLNNDNEGFYIDDIIIGFAERGEMATSAPADQQGYSDLELDARTRTTNDIAHCRSSGAAITRWRSAAARTTRSWTARGSSSLPIRRWT